MTLEEDIKATTAKITERTLEFECKITTLEGKIKAYTKWAWGFVYGGFFLSIVGIVLYLCMDSNKFSLNLLGDFYGGTVASVWSLAGLFLIYVAFLGQKQQLLNQQLEIMYSQLEVKYTRLELAGQKQEMKEQNETLRQQKFENTFFQLLNLFSTIVTSLDLRKMNDKKEIISTGRDCFELFYSAIQKRLLSKGRNIPNFTIENSDIEHTISAYDDFYVRFKSDMSHYFRTLYQIIKFVDTSSVSNKKQYVSIVRAQLSSYEQAVLFYNCLHPNGREKFKLLTEKYSLFKNLDTSLIFNQLHLDEYKESAFGR